MSDPTAFPITVRCYGVRGSIPSPGNETARFGGNTSCIELRCGSEVLILDAGSGIRSLGTDLLDRQDGREIQASLIISHTHWDHIQGLPFFAPGYSEKNQIRIFTAPGYGPRVQMALTNQMTPINFPVALDQMHGLGAISELNPGATELGPFTIRSTELNHPGGCAGFRIEAEGLAVGYLPDHEPYHHENNGSGGVNQHARIVEFVRGLDLLILDTQYTSQEYDQRIGWGHGSLPESIRLAIEGNVRRLILFHHDPAHDDRQIEQMVESARNISGGSLLLIDAAAENETIHLTRLSPEPMITLTPTPFLTQPLPVEFDNGG